MSFGHTSQDASLLGIRLIQCNPKVGDLSGNIDMIAAAVNGTDCEALCVLPELALTGYPPEDLLYRDAFMDEVALSLDTLAQRCASHALLLGAPLKEEGRLYNAAFLLQGGEIVSVYRKRVLPNYGVFDERRYFSEGDQVGVMEVNGHRIGVCVCEDLWQPEPAASCASANVEVIVSMNASPFHVGKQAEREATAAARAAETGLPIAYVNLWGGQDEVVFDGGSFFMSGEGELQNRIASGGDGVLEASLDQKQWRVADATCEDDSNLAALYRALTIATSDYINKNGFKGVVLGLSGGIDSALVLALAVDALGADRVEAVMMPSRYTSQMSLDDAAQIAENFGVAYHTVSIEPSFDAALNALQPLFGGAAVDTTEENMQARIRGLMLMALSNKKGLLVLPTGNKSEYAVGYSTLYGDMVGGFAPLKDVSKSRVFALSRWRNRNGEMIPQRIIDRPPSAELAPDQKDEDSLPAYEILDQILELYIEGAQSPQEIIAKGFKADDVNDTVRRVNLNEYKRRQAAPGPKVTPCAFGRERRYPITSGFWR
ncbi:glutamine-dependent NAD+ synthetase signal peptide protein [gamma proteobacterium HTCC5015]|nr:glutamine-dependent NAD+ synthetase signal peptide protein [gamma proteobacterium HTCC5015]